MSHYDAAAEAPGGAGVPNRVLASHRRTYRVRLWTVQWTTAARTVDS